MSDLPISSGLLNVREAAARLGLARATVYEWCSLRRLPHVKLGRALRFNATELDEWVRQNTRPVREEAGGGAGAAETARRAGARGVENRSTAASGPLRRRGARGGRA